MDICNVYMSVCIFFRGFPSGLSPLFIPFFEARHLELVLLTLLLSDGMMSASRSRNPWLISVRVVDLLILNGWIHNPVEHNMII